MRVSTISTFLSGLRSMQNLQSSLDQTQRQISSGRRLLVPSDDPIAAGRALELRESVSRLEQFDRNAGIAQNRLSQEEVALKSVNDVLQRVRELALQANNATQSDETRSLIAVELRDRLDYLVQIANQRDGNGQYLFSGNLGDVEPVSRSGSTFTYNGDQGQRLIQIGEGRQVADGDSGADVFFQIRAGNGDFSARAVATNAGTGILDLGSVVDPTAWDQDSYTVRFLAADSYEVVDSSGGVVLTSAFQPGDQIAFRGIEFSISGQPATGDEFTVAPAPYQDMFTSVERLIAAVETTTFDDASRTALTNGINAGLQDLDEAIGSVLDFRTRVGSRLSSIESQVDTNGGLTLALQTTLSSIEDLDYAEALSRLSLQVTTLEAAQQSFVRTQQLSLFNFIR
ncbi:MAG: flagellar hook-associated protein FlgL [Woeseiaceae bacterium]|nr:flagellar hook-associated protein FlgL [Woeseiaceae bacterium]